MEKRRQNTETSESSVPKISLAQFVSQKREDVGLSQKGLAQKCNLTLGEIENIESGSELFLSSTMRQKLAKGLKMTLDEIKKYEKSENFELTSQEPTFENKIEEIKDEILNEQYAGKKEIKCPNCGENLITRIAKMYDLEDNLILHPKARCSKCPFQIK